MSLIPSDRNKFTCYNINSRTFNFFWKYKPKKKGIINKNVIWIQSKRYLMHLDNKSLRNMQNMYFTSVQKLLS